MLDRVKLALRISNNEFDSEINNLIDACKSDLEISGVASSFITATTEPLLIQAIVSYCKANFGFDNPDSDKYLKAYESAKLALVLDKNTNPSD